MPTASTSTVYLVDQVIYSEEPLSDAELLEALGDATAVTHNLIVDGDQWTVALLQEVDGNTQVSVGRASRILIDFGEPESSGVPR